LRSLNRLVNDIFRIIWQTFTCLLSVYRSRY